VQTEIRKILTINGGSSSIKFAVYENGTEPECILKGQMEKIGLDGSFMSLSKLAGTQKNSEPFRAAGMAEAVDILIGSLEKHKEFENLAAIGHRIVHGMKHGQAELISDALLEELQNIRSYDPDHLPGEIALIKAFRNKYPHLPQVASFDTAFHSALPRVARLMPIPRRFDQQGFMRYGFHGLSYSYLMQTLAGLNEPAAEKGRIILAHLGNGASMAAVLAGKCVDTSMGFTATGGFMMGTRPGDLDPGMMAIIMKKESFTTDQYNDLINHQCGLLGVSETSPDMQDLLKTESNDIRAAEAISLFCYQVKKWIGSFTSVLSGLDVLVFSGGIGENAPSVRARICEGQSFMGIELDEKLNNKNATIISKKDSPVIVYVIPTDEEVMIAKNTRLVLSI
jgi:acetate kinase